MHLLNRLRDYLPNVLRHSYELKALTLADARDAIVLPARAQGDGFATVPFDYTPAAVDRLLDFLQDEQDGRVEGILLQMLCEHYERKQVEAQGVSLLDLPHIGDPGEVVRNYYEEKIHSLPPAKQLPARRFIEEGLVSEGEAMRLTLHEAYIALEFGVDKALLETLVDSRLLRAEPFLRGGYTYELSHDRLVPAVLEAREARRKVEAEEEARRLKAEADKARRQLRTVLALLAAALLTLIIAGWQYVEAEIAKAETQQALDKAEKLVNAFYFYADRFALAFKDDKFYFIDKNGDEVAKLGKWDKAEQFDLRRGLAKVEMKRDDMSGKNREKRDSTKSVAFLLYTLGNTCQVAYDVKNLGPEITALDLSEKELDVLPP